MYATLSEKITFFTLYAHAKWMIPCQKSDNVKLLQIHVLPYSFYIIWDATQIILTCCKISEYKDISPVYATAFIMLNINNIF